MQTQSPAINTCPLSPTLRHMFEARKRVFVDLLKWDVPVLDGVYEIDQFDTFDAIYLILAGDSERHRASARLLRTNGSHILRDLFPYLCTGPIPMGEHYREITRFCIEPTLPREERRLARDQLVTALAEHALSAGIRGYTAVASNAWFGQIAAFGWKCVKLGAVHQVRGESLVALKIDIDDHTLEDLERSGIYRPCRFRTENTGLGQVS